MQTLTHEQCEAYERGKAAWRAGKRLVWHNPFWSHEEGYRFWRMGWLEEDDFTIVTKVDVEQAMPTSA